MTISFSKKAYVCEQEFNKNVQSQVAPFPFYSQYFLMEIKRMALANQHIFTWQTDQSRVLIGSPSSLKFRGYQNLYRKRSNIILLLEDYERIDEFDHPNNHILNLTNKEITVTKASYWKILAPYSFDDLTDFPIGPYQKPNLFNITTFVSSPKDLILIFSEWKRRRYINSSIFVFYNQMTIQDTTIISEIETFNAINQNRRIHLYNLNNVSQKVIYQCFQESAFSIFMLTNTIFPFWSARLGCYPVVLKEDIVSPYFAHLKDKTYIPAIVSSFWRHPEKLMDLSRQVTEIEINKLSLRMLLNTVNP